VRTDYRRTFFGRHKRAFNRTHFPRSGKRRSDRFSGGTSGLSIGHISPEAANGGAIGLIRDGDEIAISISDRSITLKISDEELAKRRAEETAKGKDAFKPKRERVVPESLKMYAHFAVSADEGAVKRFYE